METVISNKERDCNTCMFHKQGQHPDDFCQRCLASPTLVYWLPIPDPVVSLAITSLTNKEPMSKPYDDAFRPEGSAFDTQVGGQHYKTMKIQPVEFCLANKFDFFQKDVIKYVTRRKGDKAKRIEDLNKAKHYLQMYIEAVEKDQI